MTIKKLFSLSLLAALAASIAFAADKPKLTLDEFFNSVSFDSVELSPDGHSVVIATERADWGQDIFRKDLWLYRDNGSGGGALTQLTQSGHDGGPQWSPDGRWVAFFSERKAAAGKSGDDEDSKSEGKSQLYLIAPSGGEAFPITKGDEEVHAFGWSPDSHTLYYATRSPWTREQKEAYKKEWKDVLQYRAAERGDTIFAIEVAEAVARHTAEGTKVGDENEQPDLTSGARALASSPWRVHGLEASPDGRRLAFLTTSVSERDEKIEEFEIYAVDLANASLDHPPHRVTRNEAEEQRIHWANDNKHVFFGAELGSVEGKYRDTQPRLYWVDVDTGEIQRWASDFMGAVLHYSVVADAGVVTTGRLGTEVQVYSEATPTASYSKQAGWTGTYELMASAEHSRRVAFVHSTLEKPAEVYFADSIDKLSGVLCG